MKTVLIAEDNPDLRDIFAMTFNHSAFQVRLAEDGEAAINCLNEYVPDVLVLDINMPRLSGFDVLAYVREHQHTHDIKVIVVTGNTLAMQDERAQCADLFLVKPVNIQELVAFTNRL
ncbi:response regulator, partial [bacterium]|nr:response regulator [bacterium]